MVRCGGGEEQSIILGLNLSFSGIVPLGCDLHNCFLASLLLGLLSPWYSFPPPARAMRGFIWGQEGPSP